MRYVFDAWRYTARTGYQTEWLRVAATESVGCLDPDAELREHVFEPGNVMQVDRVELTFQDHVDPEPFDDYLWSGGYLVEVRVPERRVVTQDGAEVAVLEACQELLSIQVVFEKYRGQYRGPVKIHLLDPSSETA